MADQKPYEQEPNLLSPNRNIAPTSTILNKEGKLLIGGCLLSDLAKKYGTPLYILDESTIRLSCAAYREALCKYYPGDSLAIYASKANSSIAISSIIKSENLGIDVVSEGELITALKGGFEGGKIFLHGNNKSEEELLLAYKSQSTIVIDNEQDITELGRLIPRGETPVKLMLRVTPGIECHTHEYIRTGHLDSKFGFDPEKVEEILYQLRDCKWAKLEGLHSHIGSQIFELQPHQDLAEVLSETLLLAKRIGHQINDLNVGGGLGIKYTNSDDPPTIQNWVEAVARAITKACEKRNLKLPRLICEPGRSLIGTSGVTLYKIGSRKDIPGIRTYLSIDGGMSDNPRPITYQSAYEACLVDRPLHTPQETVTLAGKHCESGDVLIKDLSIPQSSSGDILAVFGTGAYNSSMSSNYNRIPKPATVLVHDGSSDLIQRREQPEELLRYDVFPEHLRKVI
ncbi:diaminopimelate decarboxylase [Prochlorococcus sp. MIT 1341]|uniref:diaminopimelate decarboxylase n=1 Tax=Prochlorococcus sp. MIT 1341 TaxID=3096221 RepID=UPI002A74CDEA|nr:diaminopimelate decarboxylase [Prochlorococcus sp. MIT 1341]